jgi:heterodisulfide reductase subunit A-like polyferredoxin
MAIQTRTKGDSQAVKNVGTATTNANAIVIATGIAGPITAYKITTLGVTANLAAELGVGGAVETILRTMSSNCTILAYQVDTDVATSQLSVITERASETAADVQIRVRAIHASNIGAASTVTGHTAVVTTVGGIKLAG